MDRYSAATLAALHHDDTSDTLRITRSAQRRWPDGARSAEFTDWWRDVGRRFHLRVRELPLEELSGWVVDPDSGNIGHHTGKFFTVEGLEVRVPQGPVPAWNQPIINQPEVGILGLLVKEFDGVLHCLLQAKVEPGNVNGLQLSPTVQATRSNYTRVHGGSAVPYLEYFRDRSGVEVLADVRQSEQGAWFHRKRNRNMVVEATGEVEVLDGFRWFTLGQVHDLLQTDDLVNMDTRTVLSCLPFAAAGADVAAAWGRDVDDFTGALLRSCDPGAGSVHSGREVLSWITERRTRADVRTWRVGLGRLADWAPSQGRVVHRDGAFFDVIGVAAEAGGREVAAWHQPMIAPRGTGVVALVVRPIGGVLHALVQARVEPGFVDLVELAPTVQCNPRTLELLPGVTPPLFDLVLDARPDQVRFDTTLSEEGGRFFRARNRYLVVEADDDPGELPPDYHWVTVHQLVELLRHSHYVNVQARTLLACLHSLASPRG